MAHHDDTESKPLNEYEQKQADKRERYLERAARADAESTSRMRSATSRLSNIPMGQPILVGHHSERRHRRDIERSDNDMRKAVEAGDKADYYREKAAAVGTGGVSSDDPDAITKLQTQLDARIAAQEQMKRINAIWRSFKKKPDSPSTQRKLESLTEAERQLVTTFEPPYTWSRGPAADYQLSNNNASIKRLKKRIAELEAKSNYTPAPDIEGNGYTITENVHENRVQFRFDGKPPTEIRALLKSHAFKWSPTSKAWQRQLNNAGIYAAHRVHQMITEGAA